MPNLTCPACNTPRASIFFQIARAPALCNILCSTREAALAVPQGPIDLAFCRDCGLIFNASFDPDLVRYNGAYENSLHFSGRFQSYAESLAQHLVDRYALRNRDIIEVGSGQGDFLSLLCELGGNRGVGFDPSFDPGKAGPAAKGIHVVPDYYDERYDDRPADLICCRHVLEHIPQPITFLQTVRRAIGQRSRSIVFFEVPSALYMLRGRAVWDVLYEHFAYFTPVALRRLFLAAGFEPIEVNETYEGQFLTIEARPVIGAEASESLRPNGELHRLVDSFAGQYRDCLSYWREQLRQIGEAGRRTVIWGAGTKGIMFLNSLDVPPELVPYAVDLNPRKHGQHIVGTGQRIVPPEFLREYRPQSIIIMNPIYRQEIETTCRELGLDCEFLQAR